MGAFGELFGFDGRINRLGYLWRSIMAVVVLMAVAVGGVALIVFVMSPQGVVGLDVWGERLTTAVLLLALWSGFALATRRLRDMGFEPAHIVPVYAALWVVNTVLLEPLAQLRPGDFGLLEGVWGALQLLAAIPLLFWPSHARPGPMAPGEFARAEPTAYLNWRESSG
jgi:uncharacterized membrane protein YhaH (DUF805 family)